MLCCLAQILQNDINAHQPSVESVNDAGKQVISSEGGADATVTRDKLDAMNSKWDSILAKTRDRQLQLQEALGEVRWRGRTWSFVLHSLM